MANSFSKIPVAVQERSRQNLSHPLVSSSDFGRMDVVYCNTDIVPGDDVNLKIDGFLRGAPMPAPTYGKIDVDVRVFFVPHRILCSRENETSASGANTTFCWDDFITGISSVSHPYFNGNTLRSRVTKYEGNTHFVGDPYYKDLKRLYSQFGLPNDFILDRLDGPLALTLRINPFRFFAYQRVWWDWYRDSSLIDESSIRDYLPLCPSGQIGDAIADKILHPRYCCFKKDYYTTAKLNPQSGTRTVIAPTVGSASSVSVRELYPESPDNTPNVAPNITVGANAGLPVQWLRAANALQKYLERNNLAGSRLMERFLARFGNTPSSVALDMSEYLGGASRSLQIGDITSNNEQNGIAEASITNSFATPSSSRGTIQGQLGGKSMSDISSGNISFHAKEFGTLIAIQTIRPNVFFFEGLTRDLTRGLDTGKFDYFTPEMENLGYQPLYLRELFLPKAPQNVNVIFGYQTRYADYKMSKGVVAGDFVLDGTKEGMDSWYLSRDMLREFGEFDENGKYIGGWPTLSPAFTTLSPYPRLVLDRIFSIPGEIGQYDHFNCFYNCEVHMSRPMSSSSLPSLDEDLGQHGNVVSVPNGGVRM